MENDIKIYNIVIEYDDDHGMIRNSLVNMPAVEYNKINFRKAEKTQKLFFAEDKSEQKFMSVSMIADTPIERINQLTGEMYGVVFTKDTIKKMVNKFVMDGNINEVSFQHTDEIVDGIYLVEHFFVEKGRVESPVFADVPEGSWITTYWVKDTAQYEKLLADESFNGFSIEITAELEEAFSHETDVIYDKIEDILSSEKTDEQKEEEIRDILKIK